MILIIYDEIDLGTLRYIKFLRKHNYSFCAVQLKDLIFKELTILDRDQDSCKWSLDNDIKLDFKDISGVYLRALEFKQNSFANYHIGDREYIQQEWQSYLIYRMANVKNCVNPISVELISGAIFEVAFLFKIAVHCEFNVPEYIFSTSHKRIEEVFFQRNKQYIAQTSTIINTDFRPANTVTDNTIGLIEYVKGTPIFVHIIDNEIFSCINYKAHKSIIELAPTEKSQCLNFANELNLIVLQIILIETAEQEKFLIHASPYPNWNLNHECNLEKIYSCLTKVMISR